jgi:hypothetical protein
MAPQRRAKENKFDVKFLFCQYSSPNLCEKDYSLFHLPGLCLPAESRCAFSMSLRLRLVAHTIAAKIGPHTSNMATLSTVHHKMPARENMRMMATMNPKTKSPRIRRPILVVVVGFVTARFRQNRASFSNVSGGTMFRCDVWASRSHRSRWFRWFMSSSKSKAAAASKKQLAQIRVPNRTRQTDDMCPSSCGFHASDLRQLLPQSNLRPLRCKRQRLPRLSPDRFQCY